MPSASTPSRKRIWLRWGQILCFGGLLAGLEMVLPVQLQAADGSGLPSYLLLILALLYLLIPAIAEFLAARRQEAGFWGVSVGLLVGVVSLLGIAIVLTVATVISLRNPQPPSSGRLNVPPNFEMNVAFTLFLAESVCAVCGSLLGGWIGGKLGRTWAPAANRSQVTVQDQAP